MNKHRFRLVFSKPLGFLIPVAEITRSQRKSGQQETPSPSPLTLVPPAWSLKKLVLSMLLVGAPGWAAADIVADANNPSGTNVISAPNGVPVIDIANPNSKGLSHNRFSEFDVKNPGLIFNNSLVTGQSQIGGAVLLNPNLQRAATAILSEVTGNKPSSISGTLEVFGGKADLLIANPNGITLNGVTTLNTSNLTLSTGQVKNADSGLQFLVDDKSGQVIIGLDGVNTEGLSYFDIVAKSVELQGKLGSDAQQTDLHITAGQGTYDPVTRTFTAQPGAQGSGLAISGDAAGAMYGRYIKLISSDSGAGVRHDGLILAAKDISIGADGDIQLNKAATAGQVQITSTGRFTNTGTVAADSTAIKARDVVNQKGASLGATHQLQIDASNSVNNNGGTLIGERVNVNAEGIYNADKGQILGTDINLTAKTSVTSGTQASTVALNNLKVDTGSFSASNSELLAGNDVALNVGSFQNSATINSQNTASLTLKNKADLVIDKNFKAPQAAGLLTLSANNVTVTDELNNAGSVAIKAAGDVRNQGAVIVGKSLSIDAKGLIDNQAGKLIWTGENLVLKAGTQLLNGANSQILAMGDMSLNAGQKVQNNTGRIEAQKSLWIDAPLVENLSQSTGGLKPAGTAEEIARYDDKYGDVGETQYFFTKISLPLYSSDLTVKQAVIKAGGDLLLNSGKAKDSATTVRNVGGLVAATGNVSVEGDLENVGSSTTRSLVEILREAQTRTRWAVSSDFVKDDDPVDGSLYDMLERTFGGNYSDQWVNSLKILKTPEINQLISAVLGSDWKALNQVQLQPRWAAFKAANKTQTYYADQQAEISAGKTFVQEGGSLTNGDGANAGGQRQITIQVGSETVKTLDGELDAQFNATRADADKALKAQLDNPLFQRNQSGGAFGRIKPLYETRAKYLDQSQFLGSDYFLEKIGYASDKTVSVLGDAYFDNQLILQSVEQRLGNFFAQTQRISGTDLAKQLLDNGAALALKAGLTLGEPLTDQQIAGLEKDVVWYENREVDGQLVLAPRVYLSQKTLAARDKDAKSSALVTADTVLIDANAVNNVNGTVRGNTDTFVYSKTDINNVSGGGAQAGFFAGEGGKNNPAGQLVIAAEGKVNNQGGVMSGYEQTVVGGKGISSSATTGYDKNGFLVVRDNGVLGTALSADTPKEETKPSTEPAPIADTQKPAEKDAQKVAAPDVRALFNERLAAGPVDTTQGSSLNVISGGNIDLTGAITQSDNVSLQTTGNLNLNDLHEARSAFDSVNQSGFLSNVQITEMASSANSVGNVLNAKNLAIKTGGDLNITGGEINAQNSAIEVGGNSTINAGKDLAFHEKTTETTQLVIGGGVGAAGYEATGSWGSAAKVDTHLAAAFYGTDEGETAVTVGGQPVAGSPTVRRDVYAGRAANAQTLASNGAGARSGANKGRGGTNGANFKVGMETVTTTDSSESATYRNAQLNLGNGSVKVGGTLDIGGADINAGYQLSPEERAKMTAEQRKAATDGMPTLAISAGDIKTTKVENTEKTKHTRDELFIGVTSEVHSSVLDIASQASELAHKALGTDVVKDPNAPASSSKTLATEDRKMEIDPALTAMAAVGLATQAISGEVLGQSTTIGVKHTEQKSDSSTRAENINQLGGNISLTSTKGDIELNGVNLQGGKVNIKSAGSLTQRAAKRSSISHDETNTQSAGLTTSIGVSATGVGAGVSVGADGSGDKTTTTSTSYTNGLISGTEVSIETAGDHNLIGSNIKGNQVAVKVGGNQTITSVQDTSDMKHERNNWSASVGVAVTTNGLIQGTGSASASYGQDFDRSKLVGEQAGISGDKLDLNVAGNLNLTGAHITSQKGQGTVQVGGKINAQTLQDSREKDGGYAGGGGGISKNGLASVTLEFGRVDQVHYNANNAATIDVGDASNVTATHGISGPLNTDGDKQLNVTQNKRVAGTDVKIDTSAFGDVKQLAGNVKKVLARKTGGDTHIASKPVLSGQKLKPQLDAPKAVPNIYVEAPTAKPKFDQRVIVNTDASNAVVNNAVQNLATKNPGTVVVEPTGNGAHKVTQGALAGGTTKVEVVGHGDGMKLGGLDGKQISDVVKNLAPDSNTTIEKVALVGCGTACAKEGPSLVSEVGNRLLEGGNTAQVKGYEGRVDVDEQGHKYTPEDGGLLFGRAKQKDEGKTLYRLDFRPPEVIAKEGFAGSNGKWINKVYGNDTVYAADSLQGVSRYALEALLGKQASGKTGGDPFKNAREKIFTGDAYVYKIKADGLDFLHVGESLGFGKVSPEEKVRLEQLDTNSPVFKEMYKNTPVRTDADLLARLGTLPSDPTELQQLRDEVQLGDAKRRVLGYFNIAARHTGEVMLNGPVDPSRIELYQKLPVGTKPWAKTQQVDPKDDSLVQTNDTVNASKNDKARVSDNDGEVKGVRKIVAGLRAFKDRLSPKKAGRDSAQQPAEPMPTSLGNEAHVAPRVISTTDTSNPVDLHAAQNLKDEKRGNTLVTAPKNSGTHDVLQDPLASDSTDHAAPAVPVRTTSLPRVVAQTAGQPADAKSGAHDGSIKSEATNNVTAAQKSTDVAEVAPAPEKTLYRLDFRPPEVIAKEGFAGSTADWFNKVYGNDTVYAADSLKGVSHYALESLLGRPANGSSGGDPFSGDRAKLFTGDAYVYKIKADGLDTLHVGESLGFGKITPETRLRLDQLDTNSPVFKAILASVPAPTDDALLKELGELPSDPQELERVRETTRVGNAELQALGYFNRAARHTGEVMLNGPIDPSRIELYQRVPVDTKPWLKPKLAAPQDNSAVQKQTALPATPLVNKAVFDQHVIIKTETGDAKVDQAAQRLYEKHADKSVLLERGTNGATKVVKGDLSTVQGNVKFELVGHGSTEGTPEIGGMNSRKIADLVSDLAPTNDTAKHKVTLVGCDTACGGSDLTQKVKEELSDRGLNSDVKGYRGKIDVDAAGHKKPTDQDGLLRLPKNESVSKPVSKKHPGATEKGSVKKALENSSAKSNAVEDAVKVLYGDSFQKVADKYKVVIGLRAPNPLGASLLAEGFPSKNFHVKAKSSPTGPTAGFIAEDPAYSKVAPGKHGVQKKYIAESVKKGAELVPLTLSPRRVSELLDSGNLKSLGNGQYSANYPSGTQRFSIARNGAVSNEKGEPVRVLTNPPEVGADSHHPLPITADYDLFSLSPKASQGDNWVPFKMGSRFEYGKWEQKNLPLFSSVLPKGKEGDANMGNVSHYTRAIVKSLNKEAAAEGYKGGPLVWHGDEANNPYSPGFDPNDKPVFFIPGKSPVRVESKADLLKFHETLKNEGYTPGNSDRF